jgi:ribosomal protein S6--L-glutamate ligase
VELEPAWAELAQRAAAALGLELAGVDLMLTPQGEPWLVEVNYTPGFRGLEEATGRDIAGLILDYALSGSPGATGAV